MQQQQGNQNKVGPPENVYLQQPPIYFQQQQQASPHQQQQVGAPSQQFGAGGQPTMFTGGQPGGSFAPAQFRTAGGGHHSQQQMAAAASGVGGQFDGGQPFQIGSSSGGSLQVHTSYPNQPHHQQPPPASSSSGGPGSSSGLHRPLGAPPVPLEKRISPPGLPPQMLGGYDQMSVETLCTLGKELVVELLTRMFSIVSTLKLNIKGDNKPNKPTIPGVDNVDTVRLQLDYSRLVFMALAEIRLRIDLELSKGLAEGQTLLKDAHPSDAALLAMLAEGGDQQKKKKPTEEEGAKDEEGWAKRKAEKAAEFERNRRQLVQLSCKMKKLEWLAMCSDPAMLGTTENGGRGGGRDSTGTSSRRS